MILIHDLIKNRRSGRVIDPNRQIEEGKILSLLEAARWAPSCFNNQPWRFVVSRGSSLNEVKECLSKGNSWARRAPLIFTVASKPDLDCQIKGRDYYTLGIGLAVENLLLQGIHLGLVVHPIAGFDEERVKKVLCIPQEYRLYVLIIVGYPGSSKGLEDWVLEKERMPGERKSMEEIAFWERWKEKCL